MKFIFDKKWLVIKLKKKLTQYITVYLTSMCKELTLRVLEWLQTNDKQVRCQLFMPLRNLALKFIDNIAQYCNVCN